MFYALYSSLTADVLCPLLFFQRGIPKFIETLNFRKLKVGMQVLGDLGYTALFFGAHALASKNVAALRSESVEMQLASEGAGEHLPLADADEEMANKTAATEVVIA